MPFYDKNQTEFKKPTPSFVKKKYNSMILMFILCSYHNNKFFDYTGEALLRFITETYHTLDRTPDLHLKYGVFNGIKIISFLL